MSVLLFGHFSEDGQWNGEWYFPKGRNKSRKFSYRRIGDTVDKSLFDYVSFTRTSLEVPKGRRRGRKGSKLSKGRRSEGSLDSQPEQREENISRDSELNQMASSEPAELDSGNGMGATEVKEQSAVKDEREEDEKCDHQPQEQAEQHRQEVASSAQGEELEREPVAGHSLESMGYQSVPTGSGSGGGSGSGVGLVDGEEKEEKIPLPPAPFSRPLFGAFEGSFKIPNRKGVEEDVSESFFFYSLHKDALQRHHLLGLTHSSRNDTPQSNADEAATNQTVDIPSAPIEGAADASLPRADHIFSNLPPAPKWTTAFIRALNEDSPPELCGAVQERGAQESASGAPQTNAGEEAALTEEQEETQEEESPEAVAADGGLVSGGHRQVPPPPEGEMMVVGFGRNVYGRFSLVGAYNEKSGTLRCERKYMLTKMVGRPHRSPTPSAATSTSTAPDGESCRTSGRQRQASSRLSSSNSAGVPEEGVERGGDLYIDPSLLEEEGEGAVEKPSTERRPSSSGAPTKRRRTSSSTSTAAADSIVERLPPPSPVEVEDPAVLTYKSAFVDEGTGEVYEGGWQFGRRQGYGVAVFADGTMYEGHWVGGREHGVGTWMTGDRTPIYVGEWAEGKMSGSGSYFFANGDEYRGEWKEGARHGRGEYLLADGTTYVGDWKDNLRHGKGVLTWTDGSVFEGEYDRGLRHGRGELSLSNGFSYSGGWDKDFMEGRGVSVFPDGQQYQGLFKKGLRDGRGSIAFAEGAVYEGRFREDAIDGQGTLKVSQRVPGANEGEFFIPIEMQADIRRIHHRAGFGAESHH